MAIQSMQQVTMPGDIKIHNSKARRIGYIYKALAICTGEKTCMHNRYRHTVFPCIGYWLKEKHKNKQMICKLLYIFTFFFLDERIWYRVVPFI